MSVVLSELIDYATATLRSHTERKVPRHSLSLIIWNHPAGTVACPDEEVMSFVIQLCSNCSRAEEQQGEQEIHRVPLLIDSSSLVIAIFISSSVLFVSFKTPVSA